MMAARWRPTAMAVGEEACQSKPTSSAAPCVCSPSDQGGGHVLNRAELATSDSMREQSASDNMCDGESGMASSGGAAGRGASGRGAEGGGRCMRCNGEVATSCLGVHQDQEWEQSAGNWTAVQSGVCIILRHRGLSHPSSSLCSLFLRFISLAQHTTFDAGFCSYSTPGI